MSSFLVLYRTMRLKVTVLILLCFIYRAFRNLHSINTIHTNSKKQQQSVKHSERETKTIY